jgi:hypothetical protein
VFEATASDLSAVCEIVVAAFAAEFVAAIAAACALCAADVAAFVAARKLSEAAVDAFNVA